MRIALGQIDPTVGDLAGNLQLIREALEQARHDGARVLVLPELALVGYPPQDLLLRGDVLQGTQRALDQLAAEARDVALIVGFPALREDDRGRALLNAAAVLDGGRLRAVIHKRLLPTYDVFDEDRYFEAGQGAQPIACIDGVRFGITICEDMWSPSEIGGRRLHHDVDPVAELVPEAQVLVNISASPYERGKVAQRRTLIQEHARRHGRPFLFVSQVGGNDDLLFDGGTCAIDRRGDVRALAPAFEPALVLVEVDAQRGDVTGSVAPQPESEALEVFQALVMGTRDYARKCDFQQALVGLSGGLDSALTAAVAAEALGPENILGVAMPSRFSSQGSLDDAAALAANLGLDHQVIPIEPMFESFLAQLQQPFAGRPWDVTEENLQARIRGTTLMALSNKLGRLLLTTGNKSELATGYCTLYGDMCGGLAVISDVPKTLVYEVSRAINQDRERIPWSTIEKPPSAELAPDQRDTDSLPPYEVLDPILALYVEEQLGVDAIAARGHDLALVERIARLVDRNEYKRRQAPPGLRVTHKAFGAGRFVPIAKRLSQPTDPAQTT
jgi:NAD+ synthase/NAD+ synthase (glutamine-hydrolysing)